MGIYSEIVTWSNNKSMFVRDAIRRLMANTTLSEEDIEDLKSILMKECGFDNIQITPIPVTTSNIPTISNTGSVIKIKQISEPHNISALYDKTPLKFSEEGLTIVYGNNGTGKSSYSKILKKLCWSRDKNVQLKKNVYNGNTETQSVKLIFTENNKENEFIWQKDKETDKRLNSVFIFDSKCADIYLNKENPSEYKPAGINILERLLNLFIHLSESFDNEISRLNKAKPEINKIFTDTEIYNWYQNLENCKREDITSKLNISVEQIDRRHYLENALKDSNLQENNDNLKHKKERYQNIIDIINNINLLFNDDRYEVLQDLKKDVLVKKEAFKLAQNSYKTDTEFSIGGQAWKKLWNAAREYAISEINNKYPISSNEKGDFCILCHQPLSSNAKERMKKFDLFVKDKTSKELEDSQKIIQDKIKDYENIPEEIISTSLKNELIEDIPNLEEILSEYKSSINKARENILGFLTDKNDDIVKYSLNTEILSLLENIVKQISNQILTNENIIKDRVKFKNEFYELDALNELFEKKDKILLYYDEYKLKTKYWSCKDHLHTGFISREIGTLLESKAITEQEKLFKFYLNKLNKEIASKMILTKTRTNSGITYQQCKFSSISDNIVEVLSEGEQKIVAIANFLSESTINNTKNTIVFDDPINSLDLNYRESVAKIIVELSKDRQIIVMTHDLYFLRLLSDKYRTAYNHECYLTCLNNRSGESGIVSDEIPYLVKNVQERIDTITNGLRTIKSLDISQIDKKDIIINDLKDKMRQLLERTVEDVLINKTITRFSKNVTFKKGNLANIIVVDKTDIDFLLSLYSKYSEMIHDGSIETAPNTITEEDIKNDITDFKNWKTSFDNKAKTWKKNNGYA